MPHDPEPTTARRNPYLKGFAKRLKAGGKPHKQVITVISLKLTELTKVELKRGKSLRRFPASNRLWLSASDPLAPDHNRPDFTMSCNKGALYQWGKGVREFCAPQGKSFTAADCESVARSNMFRCVAPTESPGTLPVIITDPRMLRDTRPQSA